MASKKHYGSARSPTKAGRAAILAQAEFQSDAAVAADSGVSRASLTRWRAQLDEDPELRELWEKEARKLNRMRSRALVKKAEELADEHAKSYQKARKAAEGFIDDFIVLQREAREKGENAARGISIREWKKFDIAVNALNTAIQGERQAQGLQHLLNAQWASSSLIAQGYVIQDPLIDQESIVVAGSDDDDDAS